MKQDKIYERTFNDYLINLDKKGRFDISKLDAETKVIFEGILAKARFDINVHRQTTQVLSVGKMPHVHVDFIDSPLVNGCAFIKDGAFYVGINYGTVLILRDIFSRILSCPGFFTEVGNHLEEVPHALLPSIKSNYFLIENHFNVYDHSLIVRPKDKRRQNFSEHLLMCAMDYIVGHELGHLLHGHVDYCNNYGGKKFIAELVSDYKITLPELTLKVLEWDADCFSAQYAVVMMMNEIEGSNHTNEWSRKPIDVHMLSYWAFAVWTFFRVMDIARIENGKESSYGYPSVRQRQFNAIGMAIRVIELYGETDEEDLEAKLYFNAPMVADTALLHITMEHITDIDLSNILNSTNLMVDERYVDEYTNHWRNTVRPALVPLSRLKPLAE